MLSAFPDRTDLDFARVRHMEETDERKFFKAQTSYSELEKLPAHLNTPSCKLLHLNIHSLPDKFNQLKSLLQELHHQHIPLDFVLLCETFLNETNSTFF